ncbi:hypothetical protein KCMC57_up14040 [Kitasatospora sp. CMC57]|uniref:Restriction endonuclease type IV Mrr domain-containing protein n=1 Tax=Kitasatospora sp. CMC57 TaxID=3231513 RepID=A0AB33JQ21_9ACTN
MTSEDGAKVVMSALGLGAVWIGLKLLWGWLAVATAWVGDHAVWFGAGLGIALAVVTAVAVGRARAGYPLAVEPGWHHSDDDEDQGWEPYAPRQLTYSLWQFDTSTPRQFEEMCRELLERDGFTRAERVGGAGDLGADVLAFDADGRRIVIQCKRYQRPVGSGALQTFNGTARPVHKAKVAVMVGLNGFSAPARKFANGQRIKLVDRQVLAAWGAGDHLYDVLGIQPV